MSLEISGKPPSGMEQLLAQMRAQEPFEGTMGSRKSLGIHFFFFLKDRKGNIKEEKVH